MPWTCEVVIDADKDKVGTVISTFENGTGETFVYSARVDANRNGEVTAYVAAPGSGYYRHLLEEF